MSAEFKKLHASSPFGSKKRDKMKAEHGTIRANNEKNTKKGWAVLLSMCNDALNNYGITAQLMKDASTWKEYGIEFHCPAAIRPNKLILMYDTRRQNWSWPRDSVPPELQALHITPQSWKNVCDHAYATLDNVTSLHQKKKIAQQKVTSLLDHQNGLWFDGHGQQIDDLSKKTYQSIKATMDWTEDIQNIRYEQELEWSKLQEFVADELFMWGINTQLMRCANSSELMYCGLVFRFRPTATTATAIVSGVAAVS